MNEKFNDILGLALKEQELVNELKEIGSRLGELEMEKQDLLSKAYGIKLQLGLIEGAKK